MNVLERLKLKIGDRMDITLPSGRSFKSMIEDLSEEGYILLSTPLYRGIPIVLHLRQEVGLNFFREVGRYSFSGRVMGFRMDGEVRLIAFMPLSQPVRHQLRASFRLPAVLVAIIRENRFGPFPLHHSPDDEEEEETVKTIDISETGLAFKTKTEYLAGDRLYLRVTLGWPQADSPPIEAFALVRRVEALDMTSRVRQIGVEFINLDEDTRRLLSRYVIATQQQRLKQQRLVEGEE